MCIYYRLYDLKKSVQLIVAYPYSILIKCENLSNHVIILGKNEHICKVYELLQQVVGLHKSKFTMLAADGECLFQSSCSFRRLLHQHINIRYLYAELLTTGKLNDYLADLNEQAEAMFSRLVNQLSEKEGITEVLKAENQMLWVQRMNNIRSAAMESVANNLIYC